MYTMEMKTPNSSHLIVELNGSKYLKKLFNEIEKLDNVFSRKTKLIRLYSVGQNVSLLKRCKLIGQCAKEESVSLKTETEHRQNFRLSNISRIEYSKFIYKNSCSLLLMNLSFGKVQTGRFYE